MFARKSLNIVSPSKSFVSNKINMISSTIFYVMKLSNGKTSHEPFKRDIKKDGENKKTELL